MRDPRTLVIALGLALTACGGAIAPQPALRPATAGELSVQPFIRDPGGSGVVAAVWESGAGLPDARGGTAYALRLKKIGATAVNAQAGARVLNLARVATLFELGYDRAVGGHCTALSPRIVVALTNGSRRTYGCAAGSVSAVPGHPGWVRVRHSVAALPAGVAVRSITIRFTQGTDRGPGTALLDNVAVNGTLVTAPDLDLHVYVSDRFNHRVARLDNLAVTGWTTLGTVGAGEGALSEPRGVFAAADGRVYIADGNNNRIVRVDDISGQGWTTLGTLGSGVGQFAEPLKVFVDARNRIYVVEADNHRLVRMDDMSGVGWTAIGGKGIGVRQFKGPHGVFVDFAGRIFVADTYNHRIVRMDDMTGAGWRTCCAGERRIRQPSGIALDAAGRIYVSSKDGHRIVRMNDITGAGWVAFGSQGSGPYQFTLPNGIAVDSAGRIYVADAGNNRVVRMDDMAGSGWTTLGALGAGVGEFNWAGSVAVR